MIHLQETGTGFLVPVFGTGFGIVCYGPYCVKADDISALFLAMTHDGALLVNQFIY